MNASVLDHESDPPSSDALRAGEYVLGVLDAAERRAAQARIDAEPPFAALVAEWERHFAGWIASIAPTPAPAHVWPRVRTRLGWSPVEGGKPPLLQRVGFWRAAAGFAAAAAVAAIVIGRLPGPPAPVPPPRVVQVPVPTPPVEPAARAVTVLARDDGSPGWLASIDPDNGRVNIVPVPSPADAQGRVAELWLIPAGEAPRSLGRVSNEQAHSISVDAVLRRALAVGSTLAVTLEPEAGMPHAAPSGPIVAKGGIERI